MASQVLSGSSNVSYTNNTGQNVRIVINYMAGRTLTPPSPSTEIQMNYAGVNINAFYVLAIGRNLAFNNGLNSSSAISSNNATTVDTGGSEQINFALPTELMLAPGQTFSASCGAYNIIVIPEAG